MNAQQVFDRSVAHVIAQGKPSGHIDDATSSFVCMYREFDEASGKTLMCAAGALIPDDVFKPTMENTSITSLINRVDALKELFDSQLAIEVVKRVQSAHDQSAQVAEDFVARFSMKARGIAEEFELNTSVLDAGPTA